MNVVVDTNVIAYYWLPGAHTQNAIALRRMTDDWFVPVLWRSEFRNILAGYLRTGIIGLETDPNLWGLISRNPLPEHDPKKQ